MTETAATYQQIQHEESSWSHNSAWGLNAIDNARMFYSYLDS